MLSVSAPGKLMLFGEHAVLYGKRCIVTAIEPRFYLKTEPSSCLDMIKAPDFNVESFEPLSESKFNFIYHALKIARTEFKSTNKLKITANSNTYVNGQKVGFGSSAASVSTIISALAAQTKTKISNKELFDLSMKAVLNVQKVGSGFDAAASVYGKTFLYSQKTGLINYLNTKDMNLIVAFTGKSSDTVNQINLVSKQFKKNPIKLKRIFNDIDLIIEKASKCIKSGQYEKVGKLMNENHKLLSKIGYNIITNSKIENIIKSALKAGALGAKISGGGNGDCVIALTNNRTKSSVKSAMKKAGATIVKVRLNARGVKVESFS